MKQKRVIAVHDISCVGRCSLTAALPILSAAGAETLVLPTALLSTQTGGFSEYTFLDLTDEMTKIISHWEKLGLLADSIYTGYLGSLSQIEIVENLIRDFRTDGTLVMVDPVMGDAGKLYDAFSKDYVIEMKKLCASADIIVPNITEACLLLGEQYIEKDYPDGYIQGLLERLCDLGPRYAVLSGVHFGKALIGAVAYDKAQGKVYSHRGPLVEGFFHGTGDVFASSLLAAMLNGKDIDKATQVAVEYTAGAVERTKRAGADVRHGVDFENGLYKLIKIIKE